MPGDTIGTSFSDTSENQFVWRGCIEIRKIMKDSNVSYDVQFTYEQGDTAVETAIRNSVKDAVAQLQNP